MGSIFVLFLIIAKKYKNYFNIFLVFHKTTMLIFTLFIINMFYICIYSLILKRLLRNGLWGVGHWNFSYYVLLGNFQTSINSPPLSAGDTFPDSQWVPKTPYLQVLLDLH